MDPISAPAGSFSVRGYVCRIVNSKELQPVLDRFHKRLSEMGAGVSIEGIRVKISLGAETSRSAASELLMGHMLAALRFEGMLDSDCMQAAAEIGRELNERRAEILSSPDFLSGFSQMLANWENADDVGGIAKLCVGVHSSAVANSRMASMAEIGNPMLVIEMTKIYVNLLLRSRLHAFPPDNDNIPASACAAQEQTRPVAETPQPPRPAAAQAPAMDAAAGAAEIRQVESKTPLEAFEGKLHELGASELLIDELLASKQYTRDPEFCLKRLESFIKTHGRDFTIVALHKNRSLLIAKTGPIIEILRKEIAEISADKELLAKYARLTELLQKELDVPLASARLALSTLRGTHLCESLALENIRLLLSRVPRENLRHVMLSSPHRLMSGKGVQALLDEYPHCPEVDQEKLIRDISDAMGGKRPEAFIRAYVLRNLDSMSSRSLETAKRKADYAGRMMVKLGRMAGIPPEFTRECMEKGIIDPKAVEAAYVSAQTKDEGHEEIQPAPPTVRSADLAPADSRTAPGAEAVPGTSDVETHEPEASVQPDMQVQPQAMDAADESDMAGEVAEPAPESPGQSPATIDQAEYEKRLTAALDDAGIPYQITRHVADLVKTHGDAEEALYRFESVVALIDANLESDDNPRPSIRRFFNTAAHVEALFDPSRKVFLEKIVAFNASVRPRRDSPVPQAASGINHINVANGDEQTFQRIRQFRVPSAVTSLAANYGLDVHELIYVTLKIFRWMNNKQPQDIKKADYHDNVRRFAGEAQREVAAFHRRMIQFPHQTRVGLKSESSLEPDYAAFMRVMKQVNFQLMAG